MISSKKERYNRYLHQIDLNKQNTVLKKKVSSESCSNILQENTKYFIFYLSSFHVLRPAVVPGTLHTSVFNVFNIINLRKVRLREVTWLVLGTQHLRLKEHLLISHTSEENQGIISLIEKPIREKSVLV